MSRPGASIQFKCTESPSPPSLACVGQNPDPRPFRGKREGCQEVGRRAVFLGDPGLVLRPPPKMSITASGLRGPFLGSQSPALLAFFSSGPFLLGTQLRCEDLCHGSGQAKAPAVAKGPVSCLPRNVLSERQRRWGPRSGGGGQRRSGLCPRAGFRWLGQARAVCRVKERLVHPRGEYNTCFCEWGSQGPPLQPFL